MQHDEELHIYITPQPFPEANGSRNPDEHLHVGWVCALQQLL